MSTYCECSNPLPGSCACGWGTGLASGAETRCPQKQPSARDGQEVILVSGGHSRCIFCIGSQRFPVAHSGSCVTGHQYWLPSLPCTLMEVSWVTSQRSYLPLNPLLSLHRGSPTQAIIVPAFRGSRWDFLSVCKAQNGACKYHQRQHPHCSQSSSSNTAHGCAPAVSAASSAFLFLFIRHRPSPSGFGSELTSSRKPFLTTSCTWLGQGSLLCASTGFLLLSWHLILC